jgi:hypothetical protein
MHRFRSTWVVVVATAIVLASVAFAGTAPWMWG